MSYNEQDEPKVFVNGARKISKQNNPRIESFTVNLDEIKRELGTGFARIMVFDDKNGDPDKKKFMFVKSEEKYWKPAKNTSVGYSGSYGSESNNAYGNARGSDDERIP